MWRIRCRVCRSNGSNYRKWQMLQLDARSENTQRFRSAFVGNANARGNRSEIFATQIDWLGTILHFVHSTNETNVAWLGKCSKSTIYVLFYFFFKLFFQSYLKLKIYMNLFLAATVSGLYQGVGNDATKALFNFGFCFTVAIAFMYNPLMPVLLTCKSGNLV